MNVYPWYSDACVLYRIHFVLHSRFVISTTTTIYHTGDTLLHCYSTFSTYIVHKTANMNHGYDDDGELSKSP
jgi:hypothetical protein